MSFTLSDQFPILEFAGISTAIGNTNVFVHRWGEWIYSFGLALLPLIIFAAVMHLLEKAVQKRLASRFGWGSILATGWIGTPIHELSHVVMCWVFGHRIDAVAFFEPDKKSGRLGYVKHSSKKNNLYQEIGNVFIGIAPLVGGSLVLLGLMSLFYPGLARSIAQAPVAIGSSGFSINLEGYFTALRSSIMEIDILSPRSWLFGYLVLSVGAHMAPSRSDYAGAGKGALLLIGLILAISLIVTLFPVVADHSSQLVLSIAMQLWSLFGVAVALNLSAALLVWLITACWDLLNKK